MIYMVHACVRKDYNMNLRKVCVSVQFFVQTFGSLCQFFRGLFIMFHPCTGIGKSADGKIVVSNQPQ